MRATAVNWVTRVKVVRCHGAVTDLRLNFEATKRERLVRMAVDSGRLYGARDMLYRPKDKRSAVLIVLHKAERRRTCTSSWRSWNALRASTSSTSMKEVRINDRVVDINHVMVYAFEMSNEVSFSPRFVFYPVQSENDGGW